MCLEQRNPSTSTKCHKPGSFANKQRKAGNAKEKKGKEEKKKVWRPQHIP
jgi:hypothetical protein